MKQNEQAFLDLVTANQGIIHKVCRLYCAEEEARLDLFQEILLQLWRAFPKFRGEAKASTWMYRIALNTAISDLRKRKRRPQLEAFPESGLRVKAPEAPEDKQEQSRFLYEAIKQLSKVDKAIVMLYLEEHSYEEIAEIVGISKTHVGVKLNRIRQKLKLILTPYFS